MVAALALAAAGAMATAVMTTAERRAVRRVKFIFVVSAR
jgi:hypothetical protein